MKHNNTFYLELPRDICQEKYNELSDSAFRLYVMLNELEQRYIKDGDNRDFFLRSNESLAKDLGWSESKVKRAKAELRKTNLLTVSKGHYINPETKKKSEKCYTAYTLK